MMCKILWGWVNVFWLLYKVMISMFFHPNLIGITIVICIMVGFSKRVWRFIHALILFGVVSAFCAI